MSFSLGRGPGSGEGVVPSLHIFIFLRKCYNLVHFHALLNRFKIFTTNTCNSMIGGLGHCQDRIAKRDCGLYVIRTCWRLF